MTRPLLLLCLLCFAHSISIAQVNSKYASQKFQPDTVKTVITDWVKELSLKHPGFYQYHSKEAFTRYIDSVKNTILYLGSCLHEPFNCDLYQVREDTNQGEVETMRRKKGYKKSSAADYYYGKQQGMVTIIFLDALIKTI